MHGAKLLADLASQQISRRRRGDNETAKSCPESLGGDQLQEADGSFPPKTRAAQREVGNFKTRTLRISHKLINYGHGSRAFYDQSQSDTYMYGISSFMVVLYQAISS